MGTDAPTTVFMPVHCAPKKSLVPSVASWASENGPVRAKYARSPTRWLPTSRSPTASTRRSADAARPAATLSRMYCPRPTRPINRDQPDAAERNPKPDKDHGELRENPVEISEECRRFDWIDRTTIFPATIGRTREQRELQDPKLFTSAAS